MINAYITGEGVQKVTLTPEIIALGDGKTDEYALRKSYLDQQAYYANKRMSGEVIGVINGNSAKVTLFDNGSAEVFFWQTKKRMTAKWQRFRN